MQDLIDTATDLIRAILRFRWTALFAAWVLAVSGWAVIYQMEDQYQATARVFVDSNEVLKPLLRGIAVQPDVNDQVNLMSRMLLNRPNMEKLARMTDIDVEATTPLEKELLIDELGQQVRLSGVRGNSSLYNVSYTNSDPTVARSVVQALITIFIESTIGDERQDSESAQEFLDQQIKLYEVRLSRAEKRLSDFKRDNAGKMPGEAGGYYQRLDSAVSLERNARLELRETERRLESLQKQLQNESPTVLISSGVQNAQSQLDIQLQQQYADLAELLVRYTDRHPKISQLQDSIAALEARRDTANDQPLIPVTGATYAPNPVYEGLRESVSEAEARIAELEVRVTDFRSQTEELNNTIDSIPRVEAELRQLDRDYNIVKEQFEAVLSRRESARLSEQVEQTADNVQFRVIDPPFVPSKPSGPPKLLLSAVVLLAGFGAGAALAFGLSLFRPVFYASDQLASKTGRPVIGSVAKLTDQRVVTARFIEWALYVGLLLLLCFICLLLLAYYQGFFDNGRLDFIIQSRFGPIINDIANLLGEAGRVLRHLIERLVGSPL